MRTPSLAAVVLLALSSGCVLNRTGQSGSQTLLSQIAAAEAELERVDSEQQNNDARITEIEDRAAAARQNLARSGANIQDLVEEVLALRGELSDVRRRLETVEGDTSIRDRVDDVEIRLGTVEGELGIDPFEYAGTAIEIEPFEPLEPGEGGDRLDPILDDGSTLLDDDPSLAPPETEGPGEEGGQGEEPESAQEPAGPDPEEEAAFLAALEEMNAGRYRNAGTALTAFLEAWPESEWTEEASFLKAESLYQLGEYRASITAYQVVIETWPESPRAPVALFKQGLGFMEMGQTVEAGIFFEELIRIYPDSEQASRARVKLDQLSQEQ